MSPPRISVIIPCYNAAPWIAETLRSVEAQALPESEVIVVDDGSTDESATIVRRSCPQARLIQAPRGGPSRARNLGLAQATGEFLQFLDADDLLAPGKLAAQRQVLEASGAEIAYGDWQSLHQTPTGWRPGRLVQRQLVTPELELFTDFWCPPAVYLFRRAVVEAVGGWNERLPIIQDARLAFDCALRGARFLYCPGLAAYYRVRPSGSVSTRDRIAFVRDCYQNAVEVSQWWEAHGGLTPPRRAALLAVYGMVARSSFELDRGFFLKAHEALESLQPGYHPTRPLALALASRLVGYPRAEQLALWYRRAKRRLWPARSPA